MYMSNLYSIDFIWDICLESLYNKKLYSKSLTKLFNKYNSKKILDCSCGTGFPSIELKKNGFDLTCSDASFNAVKILKSKLKQENISMPVLNLSWQKLDSFFNEEFDAVLCRGNSISYAVSWEKNSVDLEEARKEIIVSLKNIYSVIKKGGILYIDIASLKPKNPLNSVFIKEFSSGKLKGKKLSISSEVNNLVTENKRTWKLNVLVEPENKSHSIYSEGYLLTKIELVSVLKQIGFKEILPCSEIKGEKVYDAFVALK